MTRRPYTRRSPELIAAIRALAADGATASEISRELGLVSATVIDWCRAESIPLPTLSAARKKAWADPAVRARRMAARMGIKDVLIPRWVPADLHDEFLEHAALGGEEAAASHIRRLKREMEREAA